VVVAVAATKVTSAAEIGKVCKGCGAFFGGVFQLMASDGTKSDRGRCCTTYKARVSYSKQITTIPWSFTVTAPQYVPCRIGRLYYWYRILYMLPYRTNRLYYWYRIVSARHRTGRLYYWYRILYMLPCRTCRLYYWYRIVSYPHAIRHFGFVRHVR
jgi:hypothetical protein